MRSDMAGNWDNTPLPRYIEGLLKVKMSKVTEKLRAAGNAWVGYRDLNSHEHVQNHFSVLPLFRDLSSRNSDCCL